MSILITGGAGYIAKCFANPSYAKEILNFVAKKTIEQMCQDSWRWQSNNPKVAMKSRKYEDNSGCEANFPVNGYGAI